MSDAAVARREGAISSGQVFARLRESQAWILVALLLLGAIFVQPNTVTGANGQDLFRQVALLGMLTVAQSLVLIGGGIDLSLAANVRAASVVGAAYFATPDASLAAGILIILVVATTIGLINGLLIGGLGFPPFITTFGMLLLIDGITLTYSGTAVGTAPSEVIGFYTKTLWFIPLPGVVLIVVAAVMALVMRSTVWGKSVYAIGDNSSLAGHAGIRVVRTRVTLYVVSGFIAGLVALVLLSRNGVGDPRAIQLMELLAVTAAVIGGVSLAGGRGRIIGGVGGAVFLTLVSVFLSQAGVPTRFLTLTQGVLILLALASYRQKERSRAM